MTTPKPDVVLHHFKMSSTTGNRNKTSHPSSTSRSSSTSCSSPRSSSSGPSKLLIPPLRCHQGGRVMIVPKVPANSLNLLYICALFVQRKPPWQTEYNNTCIFSIVLYVILYKTSENTPVDVALPSEFFKLRQKASTHCKSCSFVFLFL